MHNSFKNTLNSMRTQVSASHAQSVNKLSIFSKNTIKPVVDTNIKHLCIERGTGIRNVR